MSETTLSSRDLIRRLHNDKKVRFFKVVIDEQTGARTVHLDDNEVYFVAPEEVDSVFEYLANRRARIAAITRNLEAKKAALAQEMDALRSAIEYQKKEQEFEDLW